MLTRRVEAAQSFVTSLSGICICAVLLIPFLAGGAVIGDEALLLEQVTNFGETGLSFAEYARSPDGWYISHQILWFGGLYASAYVAELLGLNQVLTEALISCQTVIAGLAAIILSYVFLLKKVGLAPHYSAWSVLGLFAGGYGVFIFCMGGFSESYMTLLMAVRLFLTEKSLDRTTASRLALVDAMLICFKIYSLVFLFFSWPLLRGKRKDLFWYFCLLLGMCLALITVKVWLWNPNYNAILSKMDGFKSVQNFAMEFFSPWTGLAFCLPVLWVLVWLPKAQSRPLIFKGLAICACAGVFSLYAFFNGDVAGGRYIFPFVVALLPEIGIASRKMLGRFPRVAWLLPVAVLAFLPVAGIKGPFFLYDSKVPTVGRCEMSHPVLRAWETIFAKMSGEGHVELCYRNIAYVMDAADAAAPRLVPWRVAFLLEGGYSSNFRAIARDKIQRQHDERGDQIARYLRDKGLGNVRLWQLIGLLPALGVLLLSIRISWLVASAFGAARSEG